METHGICCGRQLKGVLDFANDRLGARWLLTNADNIAGVLPAEISLILAVRTAYYGCATRSDEIDRITRFQLRCTICCLWPGRHGNLHLWYATCERKLIERFFTQESESRDQGGLRLAAAMPLNLNKRSALSLTQEAKCRRDRLII